MACFVVPAAEAVVSAIVAKAAKSKEDEALSCVTDGNEVVSYEKIPFSRKLSWLTKLLFGGSVLLAFEHLWHGEIVPWFPFLTAVSDPASKAEMLHEMATVGVCMTGLVTLVWVGMLIASSVIEKRAVKAEATK